MRMTHNKAKKAITKALLMTFVLCIEIGLCWPANTEQKFPEDSVALFPIVQQGKYGYIDVHGNVTIQPEYEEADTFSEGLAAVKKNGKWGYIDKEGRKVIIPQFMTHGNRQFSEGLAAINIGDFSDGKWGFIDHSGEVVIQPQYELVGFFSEGLAFIVKDGKRGFLDKEGNIIIEPIFEMATWFSEGLAPVRPPGGKWGYIDRSGKFIIPPEFDQAWPFSEGLAEVSTSKLEPRYVSKTFCIDKTGKTIINHPGGTFFEGLAAVSDWMDVKDQWGYKNKQGDYVIKPQFTYAHRFSEGLAAVEIDGKWGFIDMKGKLIIQPKFSKCGQFHRGLAPVSTGGTHEHFLVSVMKGRADAKAKLGYIDTIGRYIWQPSR